MTDTAIHIFAMKIDLWGSYQQYKRREVAVILIQDKEEFYPRPES